jgi:flagellar protein FliO/FliZ
LPRDIQARHGRHTPGRRTRLIESVAGRSSAAAAAVTVLLVTAAQAAAQRTTTARTVTDPEDTPITSATGSGAGSTAGDLGGTLLRLGIGLVVVVGLILGVWHLMKRAQRGRMPGAGGPAGSLVDVVSTTPIGPTRFLHLVRVGDELILVGATDHSVTPIARIPGGDAVELLTADVPAEAATTAFGLHGARVPGPDPRVRAAGDARQQSLVDRLRSLTARR